MIKYFAKIALAAFIPSVGLTAPVNLENGGFIICDSTSGAYSTQASRYETFVHKQVSFSALIDSFGEMKMTAGDVLDFAPFKSAPGNAYGYYGQSIYSAFQVESATGRFFFTQNMPNEAFMITGVCRYR